MTLFLLTFLLGCTENPDDADGDGSPASEDCDDKNAAVYPGAEEVCDDLDNDCDGEGDPLRTAYPDLDVDGFGDPAGAVTACAVAETLISDGTDCDDTNAAVHPGADEPDCTDPVDYNCDGTVVYADDDVDGSPACEDCDDADATSFPGGVEVCDGADNDCNGTPDDNTADGTSWYTDDDGDGYGTVFAEVACTAPEGTAGVDGDCDDTNPTIHPAALETCGEGDEDCDTLVNDDDPDVSGTVSFYTDADGDGHGDPAGLVSACEQPEGTSLLADDCDDTDGAVRPGAMEVCGGVDDDCDGLIDDEDTVSGGYPWFTDADADGYGDVTTLVVACEMPAGTVGFSGDCDDTDASINPAGTEVCAAGDEDCDGVSGDADDSTSDLTTWYADGDGDGHGSSSRVIEACVAGSGFVAVGDDCDDTRASVSPDATEMCNGYDDNCDGLADDDDPSVSSGLSWYEDADGDAYGAIATRVTACAAPEGYISVYGDCDDANAAANPTATEVCGGGDEDCDGLADDGDPSVTGKSTFYLDGDSDTYGSSTVSVELCVAGPGLVSDNTDCNDADAGVNPAAIEVCGAGDEDCDGLANDADADVTGTSTWYRDNDSDSFGNAALSAVRCIAGTGFVADATDCNDADATVYPGSIELCGGADEDCDTLVNDDDPDVSDPTTWFLDADTDGFGTPTTTATACVRPDGYLIGAGDCNDTNAAVNPAADEVCGGGDDDCNGLIDDADPDTLPESKTTWYTDSDGDGYGGRTSIVACVSGIGRTAVPGDCVDAQAAINPGAGETCALRDIDDDCDTLIDEDDADLYDGTWYYLDRDGDGVGLTSESVLSCSYPGSGYVVTPDDCDDTDFRVSSGCTEPTFAETYDVIVVGTGPAGIAAALSAREMGASVLVFERSVDLGTGIRAARGVLAVGTDAQVDAGITDDVETLVAEWEGITGVSGDTEAVRNYLSATAELLDWLESYGVATLGLADRDDMGSVARSHQLDAEDTFLGSARLIPEFDGDLRSQVEITGPVMWGDELVGVRWTDLATGSTGTTGARAVVMATGGYQRDAALLAERLPGLSSRDWVYESILEADGSGLAFFDLLGASTINDDSVGLYSHSTKDFDSADDHEALSFSLPGAAIVVGEDGQRFYSEDYTSSFSFYTAMPEGDVWLVAGADRAATLSVSRVFYNRTGGDFAYRLEELPALTGDAWYGATLEELAGLIGVDTTSLQGEIDAWNAAEATGEADAFGRVPADEGVIDGTGGYYAMRIYAGVARAFGGVATDVTTEVLDVDGVAIAGLYAAGEVAGMIPGGGSGAGFGGSGSACYYGGRLAGQEAATYAAAH